VTAGQITAARMLTEMLRARHGIPPENCVTHAQVSVNPFNMRIGSHTDWARGFPFMQLGLPDNYAIAPASVYAFGFRYDEAFLEAAGGRWKGIVAAEDQVRRRASEEKTEPARYRAMLQRRYKDITASLKSQSQGGI
jgi:hypothetical protein